MNSPPPYVHQDILELFRTKKKENGFLHVSAPMVRYSKLEFRRLLRQNNVHLCFTPMIVADSFNRSQEARLNEFTTTRDDHPLIAQFAVKSSAEMLTASTLIYPYVDGVDVNCGCPQTWAIAKGYGCGLLRQPAVVHDILRTLRRNLPSEFSCSFKIRLLNEDVRTTVNLCRQLEMCGVTFITIHGRTQWQKTSHPLDVKAMATVKESLRVPLIVNGSVQTYDDAIRLYDETKADGIMVARGILANPGLFNKTDNSTSLECLQQWVNIAAQAGDNLSFQCFHHHLTFMMGKQVNRKQRVEFNNYVHKDEILQFMKQTYHIVPKIPKQYCENTLCVYPIQTKSTKIFKTSEDSWDSKSPGSFFSTYMEKSQSERTVVENVDACTLNANAIDNDSDCLNLEDCSIFNI